MERRMMRGEFTFDDFLQSYKMLRSMGPLQGVLKLIPGLGKQMQGLDQVDDKQMARVEAIILSMTPHERRVPHVIDGSRRRRIAAGSGTTRGAGEPAHRGPQDDGEDDEADGKGQDAGAGCPGCPTCRGGMPGAGGGRQRPLGHQEHEEQAEIQEEKQEVTGLAVRMRLTRVGSKKNPIYRVVVADSRSPRDGKFIEIVGRYNPQTEPSIIEFNEERMKHWLSHGAQPSEPVHRLLKAKNLQ